MLYGCGMILKPRMILHPKPDDSETKTDDSATKNDSETKKNDSETKDDSETNDTWKPKMARLSNQAVCISFLFEASRRKLHNRKPIGQVGC